MTADRKKQAAEDEAEVVVERDGAIATVWLNRPDSRNAFNEALMSRLHDVVEDFARHWPDIRAVVFAGRGKAFSAGGDLNMLLRPKTRAETYDIRADLSQTYGLVRGGPQAYVAAVHGYCVGSGLVFAGCCDFRVCAKGARFMFSEIDTGMVPGIGIARIAHLLPDRMLRRLLMLGEPCTAEEALRDGFASEVVPDDEVVERAQALAAQLAAKSPEALLQAKRIANHVRQSVVDVAMDYEAQANAALTDDDAVKERMRSFLARGRKGGN